MHVCIYEISECDIKLSEIQWYEFLDLIKLVYWSTSLFIIIGYIAIYLFIHLLNTNTMWKVINFSALSLHVIEWVNDTSDHIRYLLPYLCSHLRTLSAGISLFCLFSLCRLIFIDNWKCLSWINKILEQWYI